jgi:hypothetical protein
MRRQTGTSSGATVPPSPLSKSCLAGVDLVDRPAVGHELLGQAAPIAPCALDAPLPALALRDSPFCEASPARRGVQSLPGTHLPSGVVYCRMQALVGVHSIVIV